MTTGNQGVTPRLTDSAEMPPRGDISVIVTCQQDTFILDRAIAGILQQSLRPREVLLADPLGEGGTGARAVRLLAGQADFPIVVSPSFDKALADAQGGFVAVIDAHDRWMPGFLAGTHAALAAIESAKVACTDYRQVWDDWSLHRQTMLDVPEDAEAIAAIPPLSVTLWRTAALRGAGGDPVLAMAGLNPGDVAHVAQPLVRRHFHAARSVHRGAERLRAQWAALADPPPLRITALVPTCNRARFLPAALDSILHQTVRPCETIIVDDGSTDRTAALIAARADAGLIRLRTEDGPRGGPVAINLGLARASGDVVAILDDDDEWLPDHLECIQRAFALDPEPVFVMTDALNRRSSDGGTVRSWHGASETVPDPLIDTLFGGMPFSSSLFACRIDRIRAVGGVDVRRLRTHDIDLYLRLLATEDAFMTNPPAVVGRPTCLRRLHNDGRDAVATARASYDHGADVFEAFRASAEGSAYAGVIEAAKKHLKEGLRVFNKRHFGVDPFAED